MAKRRIADLIGMELHAALCELDRRHREAFNRTNSQAYRRKLVRLLERDERDLREIAAGRGPVPEKRRKASTHPGYKGRNAKLGVLAARITDDELREVEAAALKLSKRARERGGTPYVRSDLVRGAVLDFARWVNDIRSPAKLDEAIDVLEEALT